MFIPVLDLKVRRSVLVVVSKTGMRNCLFFYYFQAISSFFLASWWPVDAAVSAGAYSAWSVRFLC